jgi:hypothetical protein
MRTIELTGRVVGCGMRLVHQNLCDAVGRGVALNGVINSSIEVCDRWNRDPGGPGIARAAAQTIGCGFLDGRDGRSPAHSPPTRRIGPNITTADFRRIAVCTLLVAASCLPESISPA